MDAWYSTKKPILIISGEFGTREVFDTDDPLEELNDGRTEDNPDWEDMEIRE